MAKKSFALKIPSVGRGAAFGDLDNDGDIDAVIANNNGSSNLLIRQGHPSKNWIGILLIGVNSNKDAIGSKMTISTKHFSQVKYVNTAGSYLASNDKRLLFGLDNFTVVDKIIIDWPSGELDEFKNLNANQYYQIVEGGAISVLDY